MPSTVSAGQRRFAEGQEANRNGKPRSANPYNGQPHMAEAAGEWDEGWASEQHAMYGDS